jgi:hypothetical protein
MAIINNNFSDISALFINCSIKKDKAKSHTQLLINKAVGVMQKEGVRVEQIYAAGLAKRDPGPATEIKSKVRPRPQASIMNLQTATPRSWLGT